MSDNPNTVVAALETLGDSVDEFKKRIDDRVGRLEADLNLQSCIAVPGAKRFNLPSDFDDQLRDLVAGRQMAVTIGTGSAGGNASPEVLSGIDLVARRTSPVMNLVRNIPSQTGNHAHVTASDDAAGGWVGEGGTRSETDTSTFNKVDFPGGTVYARPKISEEALQDIDPAFSIGEWLVEESGRIIGQKIGAAIVSGDGSDQPSGLLDGTPEATGDDASPARAFGTIQYHPTGAASGFQLDRLGSPAGDPAGVLFDALYSLNPIYRANATWLMNSATLGLVRKFRDADGNYIFTPGLQSGQDGILLGRPVVTAEDMPDTGSNTFPVLIGDFDRAYAIVNVADLRVTVDDSITTPGQVLFYVRRRVLGDVINDDAVKAIKCSES